MIKQHRDIIKDCSRRSRKDYKESCVKAHNEIFEKYKTHGDYQRFIFDIIGSRGNGYERSPYITGGMCED